MSADVRSIAALRDWHAVLTRYGETLSESLAGVELELRRGFDWLDEQLGRWQKAVRDCEEEVVQAKADLSARKFTGWDDREPDTTVQERDLRRAKARLEYAEDQVRVVRGWIARLPKLIDELYRGPATRLTGFLEADLPRGLAALGWKIETLETYAGLRTDFTAGSASQPLPPSPPLPGGEGGDGSRGSAGPVSTSAVSQEAGLREHPSPPGGGTGGGVSGANT
jgi:hypothetical protein